MTNHLGREPQAINRKTPGINKQVQQSCRTQGQYTKYTSNEQLEFKIKKKNHLS